VPLICIGNALHLLKNKNVVPKALMMIIELAKKTMTI
jgi:hypothetical protein